MAADSAGLPTGQLPWLAQLTQAMAAAGVDFDPRQRESISVAAVRSTALRRYQQQVDTAARQQGASQLYHYFVHVRPECLTDDAAYCIAPYLVRVRERHRRLALTELRTGVRWGAESRDRMQGTARRPADERCCTHCEAAGQPGMVEDTWHMVFRCSLYRGLRCSYPHLFTRPPPREVPPHARAQVVAGTPQQPPTQLPPLTYLTRLRTRPACMQRCPVPPPPPQQQQLLQARFRTRLGRRRRRR